MAFDADGRLWVAIYNRNALVAVDPDGTVHTVVEDPSAQVQSWPTNVVFAGADRRQLVVGSIFLPFVFTARRRSPERRSPGRSRYRRRDSRGEPPLAALPDQASMRS